MAEQTISVPMLDLPQVTTPDLGDFILISKGGVTSIITSEDFYNHPTLQQLVDDAVTIIGADVLANANAAAQSEANAAASAAAVSAFIKYQQTVTADQAVSPGNAYFVDTTGGPVTLTLPASPALWDEFEIIDDGGDFSGNNVTVARNGKPIMGLTEDLVISTNHISVTLVYRGATKGWRIR